MAQPICDVFIGFLLPLGLNDGFYWVITKSCLLNVEYVGFLVHGGSSLCQGVLFEMGQVELLDWLLDGVLARRIPSRSLERWLVNQHALLLWPLICFFCSKIHIARHLVRVDSLRWRIKLPDRCSVWHCWIQDKIFLSCWALRGWIFLTRKRRSLFVCYVKICAGWDIVKQHCRHCFGCGYFSKFDGSNFASSLHENIAHSLPKTAPRASQLLWDYVILLVVLSRALVIKSRIFFRNALTITAKRV